MNPPGNPIDDPVLLIDLTHRVHPGLNLQIQLRLGVERGVVFGTLCRQDDAAQIDLGTGPPGFRIDRPG